MTSKCGFGSSRYASRASTVVFKPAVITVPRHGVSDCQLQRPEAQAKLLLALAVVEAGAVLLSYHQTQRGHAQQNGLAGKARIDLLHSRQGV
ncbi:hypothetical protein D3C75_1274430 [compost metagenome]